MLTPWKETAVQPLLGTQSLVGSQDPGARQELLRLHRRPQRLDESLKLRDASLRRQVEATDLLATGDGHHIAQAGGHGEVAGKELREDAIFGMI